MTVKINEEILELVKASLPNMQFEVVKKLYNEHEELTEKTKEQKDEIKLHMQEVKRLGHEANELYEQVSKNKDPRRIPSPRIRLCA